MVSEIVSDKSSPRVSRKSVAKPQRVTFSNRTFNTKPPLPNINSSPTSNFSSLAASKGKQNSPVVDFIKAIELRPVLWSVDDAQYDNTQKREEAWREIAELFHSEGSIDLIQVSSFCDAVNFLFQFFVCVIYSQKINNWLKLFNTVFGDFKIHNGISFLNN